MRPRLSVLSVLLGAALVAAAVPAVAVASGTAPGGPGAESYFDTGRKDCLGTATGTTSKVWYTVAGGVLSDVYEPTVDNTDVGTLQYVVTDGSTFTDLQSRDTTYTVAADPTGMACTVTATSARHHYQLITTYLTDPSRDTVLMRTQLRSATPLHLYARLDAHVNGNGGGGVANGGADSGAVQRIGPAAVPVVSDTSTVSQAANRDYAVPTFMALASSAARPTASVGYAGTASDGLTTLAATHTLGTTYSAAPNGHIVATEDVTPHGVNVVLALGFGRNAPGALNTATASLAKPFDAVSATYQQGWQHYDAGLKPAPTHLPGLSDATVLAHYHLSANVLKASEDKTFAGAIAASLSSPWGQAVDAGALVGGKPVYFGSYREVFGRDLYEIFTGLLADGDLSTARDAAYFLFDRQQLATGELPRNSLPNGKSAPDTGGDQLDETAYPILMAYESGLGGDDTLWAGHIRPAADFLVAHGPSYGVERWEEQSGYSPSTIAAEIAGLTAAATIAAQHGDPARAQVYQATADDFQRDIVNWAVTSTGPDAARYFIRLSKTGDPNAAISYNLGNGGPTVDQRQVIDGGFQELVRLGELPVSNPDIQSSLSVLDKQISLNTPSGAGYYRYGTSAAAGSADGYGDCYQPSQSSCTGQGQPWPTTDTGTGHPWPVLSGERAETDVAQGNLTAAGALLGAMFQMSSGVGLVPEQAWEDPDLAASPYGSDPATASIGFVDGKAAGSASPLSWAQAQELRLITDIGADRVTDRPDITTNRYVSGRPPGTATISITAPAAASTIEGSTTTVTGATSPGAHVVVAATDTDTDTGAAGATASATAGRDGTFAVSVPIGFGTNVITATARTIEGATGYAQESVVGDIAGGTTVLDVTDPTGDDTGPGTYQYPTAADFVAGSYDLTRFQVISSGNTVYLRTTLRALTPTFGNTLGAQLLDIYVHTPTATTTSTAAAFPTRDYTVTPAWSQRLEVQGFAAPVWQDASGNAVAQATVVASTVAKTVTIAVPAAALGTPGAGWSFAVVLAGQDGYSPDQARAFTATPGAYTFGVCAPGGTAPVCAADPGSVPRAMDVLTPAGVDQAGELDPTRGPVTVAAVPVG
ncbi:MAG TPA: glucodextranase DOMON-like domain-containing protein [Pseudonocardiaceae bacterium]|nr:glucodextranase DOMON-like domain-containing protein [Pseudonocardiaceae bacterium]